MRIQTDRAASSQNISSEFTAKSCASVQNDTLASSGKGTNGQNSGSESKGQWVLGFLFSMWEWVKYNLLFCCFDEGEEQREELINEVEAFRAKTLFLTGEEEPLIQNEEDFLPEFKKLSEEAQEGILKEIVKILKKIDAFDIEQAKAKFGVKTSEQAYRKYADMLLLRPYTDLQTLTDSKRVNADVVVLIAIRAYVKELQAYELF